MLQNQYQMLSDLMAQQAGMGLNSSWIPSQYSVSSREPDPPLYDGGYDKNKACKACGEPGPHKSEYQPLTIKRLNSAGNVLYKDRSSIKRTCSNCGCVWFEAPIHLIPDLVADRILGDKADE